MLSSCSVFQKDPAPPSNTAQPYAAAAAYAPGATPPPSGGTYGAAGAYDAGASGPGYSAPTYSQPEYTTPTYSQPSTGAGNAGGASEARPVPGGSGRTYKIVPGDNLGGIAKRYGVKREDLMRANGITDPNKIQAGKTLVIP